MSLEKAIENLTAALDRHTKALLAGTAITTAAANKPTVKAEQAKPAAPKEQPKPQAKPEVKPQPIPAPAEKLQPVEPDPLPAPKAEQVIDREALKQRNVQLIMKGKRKQLLAVMAKFGIEEFAKLPDNKLGDWAAELAKLEG